VPLTTPERLSRHDSQISRLEQVMTALAEAQVKTEDESARLHRSMNALAKAQTKTELQIAQLSQTMNELAAETRALGRQWQAYLNTLPKT